MDAEVPAATLQGEPHSPPVRMTNGRGYVGRPAAASEGKPNFPPVGTINGRGYVGRFALEDHKAELMAFALGVAPVPPPREGPDTLVPLKIAAAELGVCRRTLGRRIKASQAAQEQDGGAREAQRAITTAAA
jgi:hypothetical protein